jgi:hypothetical protein
MKQNRPQVQSGLAPDEDEAVCRSMGTRQRRQSDGNVDAAITMMILEELWLLYH